MLREDLSFGRLTASLVTEGGNWLTMVQAKTLLLQRPSDDLRSRRDRVILAVLIGCGLRRAELVALKIEDFQLRGGA